ncbi:MAG: hypothetical protein JOZ03_14835 [Gammaproteobacteria bacterium]|nr:hypothetical protein [Gammaproteobacteria bacterium]
MSSISRSLRAACPLLLLVGAAACASHGSSVPRTPEEHAANIAAAEQAGFRIVTKNDRTLFCPSAPPTGSHMGASCMTESEWESAYRSNRARSTAAHTTYQSPGPGPNAGH